MLSEHGIIALNFVSFLEDGNNVSLASVAKTLALVFPHQIALIANPGREFNDFIFIASNQSINIKTNDLNSQQRFWFKQRMIALDQDQGFVLTDNYNPLESLQTRKSEFYRQMMIESIGLSHFIR